MSPSLNSSYTFLSINKKISIPKGKLWCNFSFLSIYTEPLSFLMGILHWSWNHCHHHYHYPSHRHHHDLPPHYYSFRLECGMKTLNHRVYTLLLLRKKLGKNLETVEQFIFLLSLKLHLIYFLKDDDSSHSIFLTGVISSSSSFLYPTSSISNHFPSLLPQE